MSIKSFIVFVLGMGFVVVGSPSFGASQECLRYYGVVSTASSSQLPWLHFPKLEVHPRVSAKPDGTTVLTAVKSDSEVLASSINYLANLFFKRPLRLHEADQVTRSFTQDTTGDPTYVRLARAFRIGLGIDMKSLRDKIPLTGALLIVANHPKNGSEAIAIAASISMIRSDVKFVVTELLEDFPGIQGNAIFTNPYGGMDARKRNAQSFSEMTTHLNEGKVLIIFPSGQVSAKANLNDSIAFDRPWRMGIYRLMKQNPSVQIVPFYVSAVASQTFYKISMMKNPKLRNALASLQHVREMVNNVGQTITMAAGAPMLARDVLEKMDSDPERMLSYLRALTYSLGGRLETKQTQGGPDISQLEGLSDVSKAIVVRYYQSHEQNSEWHTSVIKTQIDAEIDILVGEIRSREELATIISYIEDRPVNAFLN
ncbi:MAG: 1-acyl-sn-glycerol-3-phosphate acyltransferase [Bdellovibrionaceae bacterium]|nr:1-acyl-sn-glycerol-3-phosphate acyltransferase [Pseudobdellovibrionaceae bacterium]